MQIDFDQSDLRHYRDASFDVIKRYFCAAVVGLDGEDGLSARFDDRAATSFGASIDYPKCQKGAAHITVFCSNTLPHRPAIYFTFSEFADENGPKRGGYYVRSDGRGLSLWVPVFGGEARKYTPEEAAEEIWESFLREAEVNATG